jgi:hypothetical protein
MVRFPVAPLCRAGLIPIPATAKNPDNPQKWLDTAARILNIFTT